jgi:5-methylcytosine-specific restriction protein A
MLGTKDASIRNGVFRPSERNFVLLFVTEKKTPDRIQYEDSLGENILYWDGQLSGRTDKLIINHKELGLEVFLMYRTTRDERPDYSFTCLGRVEYVAHTGGHPTHFTLRLLDRNAIPDPLDDKVTLAQQGHPLLEGAKREVTTSRYSRSLAARREAIHIQGYTCMICGFNFESTYGEIGKGYVEVHHVLPLSATGKERPTNPAEDLVVVCSNCHSMLHRNKPFLHPQGLKELIGGRQTQFP